MSTTTTTTTSSSATQIGPKFHFISGLPRSGSTLLSALLSQNPKFHASMSTGLNDIWCKDIVAMGTDTEFGAQITEEQRIGVLRQLFYGYYYDKLDKSVVFDTNRGWSRWGTILRQVFPRNGKIICCVREPAEIINSIEHIWQKRPWSCLNFFGPGAQASTMYDRFTALQKCSSMVGSSIAALEEGMKSDAADRLLLVPYNVLCQYPLDTLRVIYQFIGEPWYDGHDINNVQYDDKRYDEKHGCAGLHDVRSVVKIDKKPMLLSDQLVEMAKSMKTWENIQTKANRLYERPSETKKQEEEEKKKPIKVTEDELKTLLKTGALEKRETDDEKE